MKQTYRVISWMAPTSFGNQAWVLLHLLWDQCKIKPCYEDNFGAQLISSITCRMTSWISDFPTAAFEDFGKDSDTEQNWREHLGSKTTLLPSMRKWLVEHKLVDLKPHQLLSDLKVCQVNSFYLTSRLTKFLTCTHVKYLGHPNSYRNIQQGHKCQWKIQYHGFCHLCMVICISYT